MFTLLIIIYLAFISLGLPDALLGSSWTILHSDINAPIQAAGLIAMIISTGTIFSSLMAARLINRFNTGIVVLVSVLLTAMALLGISTAGSLWVIIFFAIPLGLGAGAVDATLNNFVALHYKSRHMNWLHSFWGIGAAGGPLIMSVFIGQHGGWNSGYRSVGLIQLTLVIVLFFSLPLWKKVLDEFSGTKEENTHFITNKNALKIKGVKTSLITYFCYCSLEACTGLWAASYLMIVGGVSPSTAALWTSFYYGGITVGRFLSGILSERIQSETLIRGGLSFISAGVVLLLLPLSSIFSMIALITIGLGCAPVFPNMLHLTPKRYGNKASGSILGLSMAAAYTGSTIMPPIIGILTSLYSFRIVPYILLIILMIMFVSSEALRYYGTNSEAKEMPDLS